MNALRVVPLLLTAAMFACTGNEAAGLDQSEAALQGGGRGRHGGQAGTATQAPGHAQGTGQGCMGQGGQGCAGQGGQGCMGHHGMGAGGPGPGQCDHDGGACSCRLGGRHGPPTELLDACRTLAEGAACTATMNGQALTGTCQTNPRGDLLCRPAGHGGFGPAPGRRGPPEQLVQACASLAAGDACTVTLDGQPLSGTCSTARNGVLVCRPAR